ncbi:hypothetical protein LCGC14_0984240 [marine sediment metagenome]|uniref:Uncharacterized protein n=1 Tax=marine sediment metagenome TaxID=412755 RepID=A0A0F9REC2_9ZZZZ|nr:hypothetical protein [Bacteroides sp.]
MNYDVVEVTIDKLISTFRLREWQYDIEDMVEDIVQALRFIGAQKVFAELAIPLTVNSKVFKLPRDCQHVMYIDEKSQYYRESGNFIEIDKDDGTEVILYYQAIPVDTRGYPLIPDAPEVTEAIMWYLAKVLILQKEITHISYATADAEWDWRCGSARAALNSLNLQQVNQMYQNFVRLNPVKDAHAANYENVSKANTLDRNKHNDVYRDRTS